MPLYSERLAFVEQLAQLLGETEKAPITQLRRIVERYGIEQAAAWLGQTRDIEEHGGEMLPNGSRRRTAGGVFFRIVRDAIPVEDRRVIFPFGGKGKGKGADTPTESTPAAVT